MDDVDRGAWVFQPGGVTRVGPWRFYAGEDGMILSMEEIVSPLRQVPADVWRRHGGAPVFLDLPTRS